MNYGKINKTDIANGIGVRVSIFVSGCRNHCEGCFNQETWDFNYGKQYNMDTCEELYSALKPDYVKGLSVLGGEPFEPENIETVTAMCRYIRLRFGDTKDIWVYTGYKWEDLKNKEIMNYIDVLVDGRFIESRKNLSLRFRGSDNQRIIDVQSSLNQDKVVWWDDWYSSDTRMKSNINKGGNNGNK